MQPPMTPMIDMTFLLLVYFLVSCQFRPNEGQIPANLPDVAGRPPEGIKLDPIRIALYAAGEKGYGVRYQIEETNIEPFTSQEELYKFLVGFKQQMGTDYDVAKVPVVIRPAGNVRWGYAVDAFNQAFRAEYRNIGFAPS